MDSNHQMQESNSCALIHLAMGQDAPYPQRCVLLVHCQTAALSDCSRCRLSGRLTEEDSFCSLPTYTDIRQVASFEFSGNCKTIWFNVGRYHGFEAVGLEPTTDVINPLL